MRVQELLQEETLKAYSKRLVDSLGIRRLGSGAYAHVFQHPHYENIAVKVFSSNDQTYKKYISWCLKNQQNPYVPQIVSIEPNVGSKTNPYTIVFMQKMKPISQAAFKKWYIETFGEESYESFIEDDFDSQFDEANQFVLKSKDKNLKQIWAHIKTHGRAKFDLHPGNVMMRNDQVVLTDPVGSAPTVRVDDHF